MVARKHGQRGHLPLEKAKIDVTIGNYVTLYPKSVAHRRMITMHRAPVKGSSVPKWPWLPIPLRENHNKGKQKKGQKYLARYTLAGLGSVVSNQRATILAQRRHQDHAPIPLT